jgi:hypothetical protein
MDDAKKRLLTSLRTDQVSIRIYIYSPMGEGISRLILDPHAAAVFQPARGQAIDQRRARGMSIDQAIDEVLRERSGKPS